jgi:hypothetical protein
MPTVAVLPTPRARAVAAGINPRNSSTCGIFDVAGRLGQAHRKPKYICDTIDGLIAEADFPAPFPLVRAGKLQRGTHGDSRWPVAAVDAWFLDQLPPAARGLVGDAERVQVDSRLNANLVDLFERRA